MADGGNRGSDRHDVKPFNLSEHRNARQHAFTRVFDALWAGTTEEAGLSFHARMNAA
jgi:hypothetical protein